MPASLDEAIAHFTTDDFDETLAGVKEVAAGGNPRAEIVIRALQNGQLMFSAESKAIYIQDDAGKLTDAATGEPVAGAPPADLDTVNINNRLRGAIAAALGQLTLLSGDPQKRYEAAQAVFKSREASAIPTLETAIAKETDSRTKLALELARAAILLNMPGTSDADKLAAIAIVGNRGDQDAPALLADIPARESPMVARAAIDAINTIQTRLREWGAVQDAWYGISLGSVLLLAAIGLAITFGVMGVINMAHGEMVMLGAYVTFVVQEAIRRYDLVLFDYSLAVAVPPRIPSFPAPLAFSSSAPIIRFLYGRPLETLLATWGLSLILQQAVRTSFGPTNKEVGNPAFMSGAFDVGGITITYNRLWIICFFRTRRLRRADRAVATSRGLAWKCAPSPRIARWRLRWASAQAGSTRLLSAWAPASPAWPAWRCRRSTMSAPISARVISSTASWSWCSAGSAICGALSSARSCSVSPTSSSNPMPARCSARSRFSF